MQRDILQERHSVGNINAGDDKMTVTVSWHPIQDESVLKSSTSNAKVSRKRDPVCKRPERWAKYSFIRLLNLSHDFPFPNVRGICNFKTIRLIWMTRSSNKSWKSAVNAHLLYLQIHWRGVPLFFRDSGHDSGKLFKKCEWLLGGGKKKSLRILM